MGVTNRARQCVSGIGLRRRWQGQQSFDHLLDLFLFRVAIADHGLFNLQGGVFEYRKLLRHCCADRHATRLTEQQSRLRVNVDENFLHRHLLRLIGRDNFA